MEYASIEAALGMIVFGPEADSLEGMQWTAAKLRQAATLLEYRYAIERRYAAHEAQTDGLGPITGPGVSSDQGQQLAPAKRKRNRSGAATGAPRGRPRNAANGTGAAATPLPGSDPLFPPEGATE
jgi:hypothetical protein